VTKTLAFIMNVNDPAIAAHAAAAGVDRLFVDVEVHGKAERQAGLSAWQSHQTLADVSRIRAAAPGAHVLVRVNPLHDGTAAEIDEAITRGADSIMLPMFRSADEATRFCDLIGGRAEAVLLAETVGAVDAVTELAGAGLLYRVHFGMNDLSLDMGSEFLFQPLAEGAIDDAAAALREHEVPFGIGGLARWDEGVLPPWFIIGEHARLGSDMAILSRTFHRSAETLDELIASVDLVAELKVLRDCYAEFLKLGPSDLADHHQLVRSRVRDIVEDQRTARLGRSSP
jgi:uncharacterized membrane protein